MEGRVPSPADSVSKVAKVKRDNDDVRVMSSVVFFLFCIEFTQTCFGRSNPKHSCLTFPFFGLIGAVAY